MYYPFALSNLTHGSTPSKAACNSPNVILINADDLGYGDLNVQGGVYPSPTKPVETPNISRLAQTRLELYTPLCLRPQFALHREALY